MRYAEARNIIDNLFYRNGWDLYALEDVDPEFMTLYVEMRVTDSDRENVKTGWLGNSEYGSKKRMGQQYKRVRISKIELREELERLMLDLLFEAEKHETREFLRRRDSHDAPFHPHREEGNDAFKNTMVASAVQKFLDVPSI